MPTRQAVQITFGARVFALIGICAPVLWYRDRETLIALLVIASIWGIATIAERSGPRAWLIPYLEAACVGVAVGVALESSNAIATALAVPPFTAAVLLGVRGSLVVLSTELVAVFITAVGVIGHPTEDQAFAIFTWTVAGLGLGMIGSFVHASAIREPDELAPYLDAQRLIRQLLNLSGELRSGLDATSLAGSIVSRIRDELPTAALAVYLPRGEVLVPLITKTDDQGQDLGPAEDLAVQSWARTEPLVDDLAFAFPLGDSAVVAGVFASVAELDPDELEEQIVELTRQLRPRAVQLDTALLFTDFRDAASADVRRRLAREMHDGVAQDIASLGYLVDALAARPASDKQAEQFAMLRERITKVVAEVRQSVLTLRTSVGEAESLGTAIGTVARHLSESSGVPISVRLDEHSTRLRSEVEAELFRITQEAMNNAIKHSGCTAIEVTCRVHAPDASIRVADNGRGMGQARSDSHGMKIMRERARLIGAELAITDNPSGGLVVTVQVGTTNPAVAATSDPERVAP